MPKKHVIVIRHLARESLGRLAAILAQCELPLTFVDCGDPRAVLAHADFAPEQLAGLVVMGGLMSANDVDRHPFLATEVRWLRQAADAGLPILGICLGAQLLAKSLGARVYPNPIKEIGWRELELLPAAEADGLLSGSRSRETVFQWHADTFDLAAGAVHLARSAACQQQAFRYGRRAYGLQFHLEVNAAVINDWLGSPEMCGSADAAMMIDPVAIRRQSPGGLAEVTPLVERVFGRFAAWCRHELDEG